MSDLGYQSLPPQEPQQPPPGRPSAKVSRLVILLVLVLVLVGGGFAARALVASAQHNGPTYPSAWDARIAPYAKIAERQRGLYFKHPVAVHFLAADKFKKTVTSDETKLSKKDREELDQALALLRAFGLIKGNPDLFEATNDASGSGTLAYYSFEDRDITIRGEKVTPAMRSTLVHELTHVLQDQNFGIGKKQQKLEKSKSDESAEEDTVLDALIEGDAERIETSYRQSLGAKQRKALDSSKQDQFDEADKTYKKIPKILITMMTSPYTLGEAMVQTAVADDGNSAVDALFRKTPPNESALLDPLKGLAGKTHQTDVEVPELADGEKRIDSGQLGSLTWYFMLAERLPLRDALAATDGRAGDSYTSFKRGDDVCVRAAFAGATPADSSRMLTALQRWIAAAPGSPAKVTSAGGRLSFESCDPGAKATVGKDDSDQAVNLLLTRAYLGVALVKRGATRSRADCLAVGMAQEFTVPQLTDPKFAVDVPNVQPRMQQIGASCTSA
jgi:hypothetical protein